MNTLTVVGCLKEKRQSELEKRLTFDDLSRAHPGGSPSMPFT
jgi:hypothetical protein